jgi:hypothetical protein
MDRRMLRVAAGVGVLALASACAQGPNAPTSPSAAATSTTANPDGSTLKVSAPSLASPIGGARVATVRPTFTFAAAAGRFAAALPTHRLEVLDAAGTVIAARSVAAGQTSFAADTDLATNTNYLWRVRAELDGAVGPWSGVESFATPVPVVAPPTGGGSGTLPFPVPAECGPGGIENRFGCASAIARQSAEWAACARGNGVACHRFTRQVAFALAQADPRWQLIQAAPGGYACDCNRCGPSDGSMFREDTVVHNGNRVFDMIQAAGGPAPQLQWSAQPGPRAVDSPRSAPLCQ